METHILRPTVHAVDGFEGMDVMPSLLRALRDRPGLIALDSAGGVPRRWSLIGLDPFVDFDEPSDAPGSDAAPQTLDDLEALLSQVECTPGERELPGPFSGGFMGALGYELGVRGEALRLPAPLWSQPPIIGGLYRDWLVIDHGEPGGIYLVVCEDSADGSDAAARASARAARTLRVLTEAASGSHVSPGRLADGLEEAFFGALSEPPGRRTVSRAEHCRRIEAARDQIARGEIYQANISHRMVSEAPADALELYLRLRQTNPAPYMAFARFRVPGADCALLSSSPELLVEMGEQDGVRVARTRPIKGTIRRGRGEEDDQARRAELLASEKDLAELAMIVDLERNDLGRIAEPGGVTVGAFPELETYASVHHLVADVRAKIAPEKSAIDVVASMFPGGSITGAPKLRSMEVIADLEREGRGFFTGSIGFIDARGHAGLSILIRTMVHRRASGDVVGAQDRAQPRATGALGEVSFHVGGGITWRSEAGLEDDETLWKAAGMLRALSPGLPGRRGEVPGGVTGSLLSLE